ncbi:MAG: veratrol--corrinoid protein metyltransferase [Lachnospiraceae bacterium]|nr:veratrol--corrinoid protein metyltransferase [Lachnospiraceae bacterium]
MAQLTEKENYFMCLRGEVPEWIPHMAADPSYKWERATAGASPSFLMKAMDPNGDHKDIWGVEHVTSKEAGGAMIPKTWDFILDDITKWRDVIKAPNLDEIDFEQLAKKDLEKANIDRSKQAVQYGVAGTGYFQHLMAFMGFTEGLCALYEEPEECEELFQYLSDFYVDVVNRSIDYYQPDIMSLVDDTAAWGNPFISVEMYEKFLLPHYKRLSDIAHDRDMFVSFHNCGKCECFVDDMVNVLGVNVWNPAQNCNDLVAIKEKYGSKFVMAGCINSSSTFQADLNEEQIREIVWDVANTYAPGGGFCFMASFIIPDPNDQKAIWKRDMVNEVMHEVSREFYKK